MNSFRKSFIAYFSAPEMIFETYKLQIPSDFCATPLKMTNKIFIFRSPLFFFNLQFLALINCLLKIKIFSLCTHPFSIHPLLSQSLLFLVNDKSFNELPVRQWARWWETETATETETGAVEWLWRPLVNMPRSKAGLNNLRFQWKAATKAY